MIEKSRKTTIAASICTLVVGTVSITAGAACTDLSPFGLKSLSSGYMVVAEGKCGEGKCGSKKATKTEGKCGGTKGKKTEGKCGGDKDKKTEGKCGEGKCGGKK